MFNVCLDNEVIATVDTVDGVVAAVSNCAHNYIRTEGSQDVQYLHRVIDMFAAKNDYKYTKDLMWTVFGIQIVIEYDATGEILD